MSTQEKDLGPFEDVRGLHFEAPFPSMLPVRQAFDAPRVDDVRASTVAALESLRGKITPGMTVALTAGSRGIRDKPQVLRTTGDWLRACGAEPFVVPAMGSHGGATAHGQIEMLRALDMTEQTLNMPIKATMDTVEVGQVPGGPMAYLDANAAAADGIIAVNRIKAHTDFNSEVESGVGKIIAIGLGKQRGAEAVHVHGPGNLGRWIPQVAREIIGTGKILGGLAIVEDAHHRAAKIAFLGPEDIAGPGEMALLTEAKRIMATLPFDDMDVVIVDEMGKDLSGTGIDTNVIGRMMIRGNAEFECPRIANIVVLNVTEPSHGNAIGVGLADFIPFRVLQRINLKDMYINAMTSGLGGPQRAQIPMAFPTDRSAIAAAILTCGRADTDRVRVVRLRNTSDLEHLLVSQSLQQEVVSNSRLSLTGPPGPMTFDGTGRLRDWPVTS